MYGSRQMFSLADLTEETGAKLKQTYKNGLIDNSTLSMVWGHTCIFIEEQMVKGKAVTLPGLGLFTFKSIKQDLGTKGTKVTKFPVFVAADSFCNAHDIKKEALPTSNVPVPSIVLNNALIASQAGTLRDVVVDFHKEAVRCIGAAIRNNKGVSIELENIGYLTYSGGILKATFNSDFTAQIRVANSPSKTSTLVPEEVAPEIETSDLTESPLQLSFNRSIHAKVNNFVTSRPSTANGRPVILPSMDIPDRPKHPSAKLRSSSDPAMRSTPSSPKHRYSDKENDEDNNSFYDGADEPLKAERQKSPSSPLAHSHRSKGNEEDTCEHCLLVMMNDKASRQRQSERQAEEAALRTQKSLLQELEDKEQANLQLQRAKREETDLLNRSLVAQKQEATVKQKQADFYGDMFYARKPTTPDVVKKSQYRSDLEEQMLEKSSKSKQSRLESRKELTIIRETQKEADERMRALKQEEKMRRKEHGEYLKQQMAEKSKPGISEPSAEHHFGPRFEKSSNKPSFVSTSLHDSNRPSTSERNVKRRSFDTTAQDLNKELINQRRQREEEIRMRTAKEQEDLVRAHADALQQQMDEDIQRKAQTRELLRNAWNNQLEHKRTSTLTEFGNTKPTRLSLDMGELSVRTSQRPCVKCGRGIDAKKNFKIGSGDFRKSIS